MASRLQTLQLLSILLFSYIIFIRGQQIVEHWSGYNKGTTFTTRNGRTIEAYLGIPYAKPPVGSLRFRSPEEAKHWEGIRDATTDGNQCPQLNDSGEIVGDEDCLYLNVYTPGILTDESQTLFPTMVFIHGGGFVRGNGSSTMYGPEYLLDKDVVLVTINYRLGVLGFLSTGDDYAPGNFGLKDQVLALQWVKRNIAFFRGNRDQVTVFGHDAGGVSAQLHSLSNLSDGLFKQFISQSGTTYSTWAFKRDKNYKDYAKKLGKYLNCATSNSQVLINCLREKDIYDLVDSNKIFDLRFFDLSPWGPTIEPKLKGAFITVYPYDKILRNEVKDYPSIIGSDADEGLMVTAQLYSNDEMYEKIVNNLDDFILDITKLTFDKLTPKKYAARIKDFFFTGTELGEKETILKNMTNLISDTYFLISGAYLESSIIGLRNYSTYLYSFDYRGTFSETSRVIGSNENIGVTHGDVMIYIFPPNPEQFGQQKLKFSDSDEQMIDTMVDMWTSFAYTGIPTTKRFPEPNFWQPYRNNNEFLIIGDSSDTSLSRQKHFHEERMTFWLSQIDDQIFGGIYDAHYNRND